VWKADEEIIEELENLIGVALVELESAVEAFRDELVEREMEVESFEESIHSCSVWFEDQGC